MKNTWIAALLLCASLSFIGGCGRNLDGKYSGKAYGMEVMSAEFKPGGKVFVSTIAGTTEGTYNIDGDKVIVAANGQNMVLTMTKDGSLAGGPMGVLLRKAE